MAKAQQLSRASMLQRYLDNAGSFGGGLEATVLRSESVQMREVLAYGATYGTMTESELTERILSGSVSSFSLNQKWLVRLAYVTALQNKRANDTEFAIKALELAKDELTSAASPKRFNKLLAELLFEHGRYEELDDLLHKRPSIKSHFYSYIAVDSRSPFVRSVDSSGYQRWLDGFNRQFLRNDLTPVYLRQGEEAPFNRLETLPEIGPQAQGPLVTVIMTSFKPQRDDILQSARSVLAQTWRNLELLVIDDASPSEYSAVLEELEALDHRVRVIPLEVNGGTYAARNVGIAQAQGEFITGQDADDWSHPQRIQTQVNHLLRNPRRPGNQVFTVNMTEDLVRIRTGYSPFIPSAPTLMVRTSILRELGGYLPARKAADNELRDRVSAYVGTEVYQIAEPLIFMRILPDSLSRADFRPGWQHPARRAFWSSYRTWHSSASKDQLRRAAHETAPIYIPPRFTETPEVQNQLDFVFTADWCEHGETQLGALEEITLLIREGYRIGVMHLENGVHLSEFSRTYIHPLQDLISRGQVTAVLADEDFHDVGVMLVSTPELMEFVPEDRIAFSVQKVVLVADKVPTEPEGFQVNYLADTCARNAELFFGHRPLWLCRTEAIQRTLRQHLPATDVSEMVHATVVDSTVWHARRTRTRGVRPVVGRWAGDRQNHWPQSAAVIDQIWPTDGSVDVRLYGDARAVLRVLGGKRLPAAWINFRPDDIRRATFYRTLDFFVHYTSPSLRPERELAVLEALATGCIAVLPPSHAHIYGDAAVYAEAHQVTAIVNKFMNDPQAYVAQSRRGAEFVRAFGAHDYLSIMRELRAQTLSQQEAVSL